MPVDPNIPLSFNGQASYGPQLSTILDNQNALMVLAQKRKDIQNQNALAQILSDPTNIDPKTGLPTSDARAKVFQINPQMGMQLAAQESKIQTAQAQAQVRNSDLAIKKHTLLMEDVLDPSINAYDDALKQGMTPQQAAAQAQKIYTDGLTGLKSSGVFSEAEADALPGNFDPIRVRSGALSTKDLLQAREREDADKRADASLAERERHDAVPERTGAFNAGMGGGTAPSGGGGGAGGPSPLLSTKPLTPDDIRRGGLAGGDAKTAPPAATATEEPPKPGPTTTPLPPPRTKPKWSLETDPVTKQQYAYDANNGVSATMDHKFLFNAGGAEKVGTEKPATGETSMSKDTLTEMAAQYLAGDKSVFQNLGRGAQSAANITALREEITRQAKAAGMSPADVATKVAEFSGLTAGERSLGTRSAQMGMATDEASRIMPLAREASAAVSRGRFVPLNKAIQAVEAGSSDKALARFVAANQSLINVYARAMSPTGVPTVSDKDHAREMLSTAQSDEAYDAVLDQMQAEMDAARKAPGDVKVELSGKGAAPAAGAGDAMPRVKSAKDYNDLPSGKQFIDPDGNVRTKP
jgi:hypothetical protein